MGEVIDVTTREWQEVRPDVARRVWGKTLLKDKMTVTLTRVLPGGGFSTHQDDYDHLFFFLSGEGVVQVGEEQFSVRSGEAVRVAAGEDHAYETTGAEEMMLLSINC